MNKKKQTGFSIVPVVVILALYILGGGLCIGYLLGSATPLTNNSDPVLEQEPEFGNIIEELEAIILVPEEDSIDELHKMVEEEVAELERKLKK
jgi:hypothetical protein